jgi:hypothetical protein
MFCDDSVAGSWPALVARLDAAGTMPRWAAREPALTGMADVGDLAAVCARGADRDRADQVIGALVRRAARDGGDDPDAVLVLLHLLSDGVLALAARLRGLGDLLVPAIVAELTCQIRVFPWRRRTRAYAANLMLDTKHVLWTESAHNRGGVEDLLDPHSDAWEHSTGDRRAAGRGAAAEDDDLDLVDLLMWAARTAVCPPGDLVLLLTSERVPAGPARHALAAEFGLHERTLRRRRRRTLTALREAGGHYLRAA